MFRRALLLGLGITGLACAKREPPARGVPKPIPVVRPPPAPIVTSTDPQVVAGAVAWKKYCALCHGPRAQGYIADHAPSLVTPTFLATASDDFLRAAIGRGRPGTAMAGYGRPVGGPLDDATIGQLIAFVRNGAPAPAALPATPVVGDAARGATVYAEHCQVCHGDPATRGDAIHLANPMFLATASDAFIRRAIVDGRTGTKMISFTGTLADTDIDAVVAHLRSWARAPAPAPDPASVPVPTQLVLNPKGKPPEFVLTEDRYVTAEQVKRALDGKRKLVIADARAPSDWLRLRIPGSISVPYYDTTGIDALPKDGTWIVAYCACPHHASGLLVDELRKRGFANTAVLDEGIMVWQKLGFPVIATDTGVAAPPPGPPGKVPPPVMRPPPSLTPAPVRPPSRPPVPAVPSK